MARGRPEVPKHLQKKVARQLLERQKRAGVYEKGLEGLGKGFLAGSAYPMDVAEMIAKGALTSSASYKAATMRPRGGGIEKVPPPVQDPKLKGTYPYFAKKMGLEPDSPEAIAGSVFSPEPFSKIHALAALGKLGAAKLAGLGMGAAMFGGLKKVGKAEKFKNINALSKSWDSKGIKNHIYEKDGTITLTQIEIPKGERGQGIGSESMQELIDYADLTGQRILLTPSTAYGGTSVKRLEKFYKRFGFKSNVGRTKDFRFKDTMKREPDLSRQSELQTEAQKPGPIFTSPGAKAAADISKETIPANKVRSQLEGRGVNKDEMEWTGFNEWIKTKKGEVSKAEIEEFFAQNQIEVREVVRGEISQAQKEKIATDEVLHDLRENYRDRIIDNIIHKKEGGYGVAGGINDPAVVEAFEKSVRPRNEFDITKWEDLDGIQKQAFARRYRIQHDITGRTELDRITDAGKQYDDLLEKWGSGEINEAEMNQLDEMFEGVGSYYDGEMQRTVVPEGSFIDRMYQNTLAEIEAGTYPIEHLNIPRDALPVQFGSPSWQLPGGENYRELVLMVPPKKVPWTKEDIVPMSTKEYVNTHPDASGPDMADKFWHFKTPDGIASETKQIMEGYPGTVHVSKEAALKKVLDRQPDPKPRYTAGHYPEDDVVAHIRFNERVDPDGNKVLFIEEIQGDWAHKGQEMGFKREKLTKLPEGAEIKQEKSVFLEQAQEKLVKLEKEREILREQRNTLSPLNTEYQELQGRIDNYDDMIIETTKTVELDSNMYSLTTPEGTSISFRADDPADVNTHALKAFNSQRPGGPQRGPFVTDTHQWTNLALKRMIRWASDNGFDSIAWVTGKQSAERYKASTMVDSIYWNRVTERLVAIEKGGNKKVIDEWVPEDKLVSYIGKEPANKLLEFQPGGSYNDKILGQHADGLITADEKDFMFGSHMLEGPDLDVGGEYHKLIYDQVLTAQAKKIGKKHGAKVEEGEVIATDPEKLRKVYEEDYSDSFEMLEIRDYPEVFEDELASIRHSPNDVVIVDPSGEYLRDTGGDIIFFDDVAHAKDQLNYSARTFAEEMTDKEILEFYEDADEAAEKVWSMRLTDKLKQASKDGMPYYVALPPLVIGGAAAQRTDAQRQQSKSDAQAILAN